MARRAETNSSVTAARAEANGSPGHFHVQMENSFAFRTGCDGEFVEPRALIEERTATPNRHQYTFTMRPGGGTGFDVYIDGVLGAPEQHDARVIAVRPGRPHPPVRPRKGRRVGLGKRYFLGKVKHFAIWDSALTSEQFKH